MKDERAIERVYVTHQPCAACAQTLIALGGVRIVRWLHPYRLTDGTELLVAARDDSDRLSGILDDLLDLNRIASGKA
jgi:deoxycytidylate deaminase